MGEEDDALVEDAERLGVGAAGEIPERLDELVGTEGFGGVEAAVDPDDGAAFGGEGAGLVLGETLGAREALGDGAVVLELREVGGGGADDHPLGATFLGFSDIDEAEAIGGGGECFEIRLGLRVGRQVVVVADGEAEMLLRRGEGRGRSAGESEGRGEEGEGGRDEAEGAEHSDEEGTGTGKGERLRERRKRKRGGENDDENEERERFSGEGQRRSATGRWRCGVGTGGRTEVRPHQSCLVSSMVQVRPW